jgi:oxygen-independent coproporphyrinogen-3 oxidase
MLEIVNNPPQKTPGAAEPARGPGRPELTRKGFLVVYPTFRYWHKDAVADDPRAQPLNVYVHMPYCIQRCAYCYFKTTTLKENRLKEIDRYVDAVCRELALGSQRFGLKERPVETVYFGGGTPTLMSEENLDKVFAALHENFTLVADPQITVEGEPVTLTERKAAVLERHRVNRISLGIQSFKEEIVFQTGRRDTEEQAMRAIALAKSTGADVNIDLISGLAGETPESWAYSVQRALEAEPHNITIYKLELYANTPYYSAEKHQEIALPSDAQELEFIQYAVGELKRHDYRPANTFTFTKGGAYDQKHTRSKWLGNDNYAVGVSAFGSLGAWNYQNLNDIPTYTATIESGKLPAFRGYTCTTFEMMLREVVMGIKLIHLSLPRLRSRHGIDLRAVCATALAELEEEGFIQVSDESISLTDHGVLYGDWVAKVLEGSLKKFAGAAGESRARVLF